MATVIAGVSGAIGSALAERYLGERTAGPVSGLARQTQEVQERLRHHPDLLLVSWQAEARSLVADDPVVREVLAAAGGITTVIYAAALLHDADPTPEKRLDDLREESMLRAFQVNFVGF